VTSDGRELVRVGYFRELRGSGPGPSLYEARGKRSAANKDRVLHYLRTAKRLTFSPGVDRDYFDPSKHSDPWSTWSDGTYAWPQLLAYYLEHYDVELPAEFERHMEALGWQPPR
jgi:hypothetical protein